MDYAKQLHKVVGNITYKGCVIHKEGNRFRWGPYFFGTVEEAKAFIDKPTKATQIAPNVFVGENHPLHPDNDPDSDPDDLKDVL